MEQETKALLAILDKQIDRLILNTATAQKILEDMVESSKKYQSGLLPEEENATNDELTFDNDADKKMEESLTDDEESVLPDDNFDREQEYKEEEK